MSFDIPGRRELPSLPPPCIYPSNACFNLSFLLLSTKSTVFCVYLADPPLIDNYDVKRCFEVDAIFHYQIPGGLATNTTRNITEEFYSSFLTFHNLYLTLQQCNEVNVTLGNVTPSPPGVSHVYFRVLIQHQIT